MRAPALLAALGMAALVACQAPPGAAEFTTQFSLYPFTVKVRAAELGGPLPTTRLRLSTTGKPVPIDITTVRVDLYPDPNGALLATRTVDLAPPLRIGTPGGPLPVAAFTELDVFDAEARRILAAGPERKFMFRVTATATRPDGGDFSPYERSNRQITGASFYVEVVPDAVPTASPSPAPSPTATPCLVTPGPNDPNGTPAPCPTPFVQ